LFNNNAARVIHFCQESEGSLLCANARADVVQVSLQQEIAPGLLPDPETATSTPVVHLVRSLTKWTDFITVIRFLTKYSSSVQVFCRVKVDDAKILFGSCSIAFLQEYMNIPG
jgi:hypothetical protein